MSTWAGLSVIPAEAAEGPDSHHSIHLAMEAIRHSAREDGIDPGTLRFSIHGPARVQGVVLTRTDPITGEDLPPEYLIRGTTDSGEPFA